MKWKVVTDIALCPGPERDTRAIQPDKDMVRILRGKQETPNMKGTALHRTGVTMWQDHDLLLNGEKQSGSNKQTRKLVSPSDLSGLSKIAQE